MNFQQRRPIHAQRRGGFTLAEILIAMAVFLIGFIAVASLFPAAAVLQKRTIDDVHIDEVARSAKAMIAGRRFLGSNISTDGDAIDTDGQVHPMPSTGTGLTSSISGWTIQDRSFPTIVGAPYNADYFWVPVVRDADTATGSRDWQVFLFVLRRDGGTQYNLSAAPARNANPSDDNTAAPLNFVPKVRSIAASRTSVNTISIGTGPGGNLLPTGDRRFIAGDLMLDNNVVIYRVATSTDDDVRVDGLVPADLPLTDVWYGHRGSGGEPTCKKIIILTNAVN